MNKKVKNIVIGLVVLILISLVVGDVVFIQDSDSLSDTSTATTTLT